MAAGHLRSRYQLRHLTRALAARKDPQRVSAEALPLSRPRQLSKPKPKRRLKPRQLKWPKPSSKPHTTPRRVPTLSASLKHTLANSKS